MVNRSILKKSSLLPLLLSLSISIGLTNAPVNAESADSAPAELKTLLRQIELAANSKDLTSVMNFYSPSFTNSDGLNYESFSQALSQLWKRYPNLNYSTQLESWNKVGNELVADTVTSIEGKSQFNGIDIKVKANIRSRQYFEDNKLVKQEIITEKIDLASGENPPNVKVILPESIKVGEQFDFDVIVQEPLGNEVLLGTAIDEKITSEVYLNPSTLKLEALSAGGIFKRVNAPKTPDKHWLSAILVRSDGFTLVTERIEIKP